MQSWKLYFICVTEDLSYGRDCAVILIEIEKIKLSGKFLIKKWEEYFYDIISYDNVVGLKLFMQILLKSLL